MLVVEVVDACVVDVLVVSLEVAVDVGGTADIVVVTGGTIVVEPALELVCEVVVEIGVAVTMLVVETAVEVACEVVVVVVVGHVSVERS